MHLVVSSILLYRTVPYSVYWPDLTSDVTADFDPVTERKWSVLMIPCDVFERTVAVRLTVQVSPSGTSRNVACTTHTDVSGAFNAGKLRIVEPI